MILFLLIHKNSATLLSFIKIPEAVFDIEFTSCRLYNLLWETGSIPNCGRYLKKPNIDSLQKVLHKV